MPLGAKGVDRFTLRTKCARGEVALAADSTEALSALGDPIRQQRNERRAERVDERVQERPRVQQEVER